MEHRVQSVLEVLSDRRELKVIKVLRVQSAQEVLSDHRELKVIKVLRDQLEHAAQ